MTLGWELTLLILFGSLLILMASGLPIGVCFLLINVVGVFLLMGGVAGLKQVIYSFASSITMFSLVALPMFILMGEVMFQTGIAPKMLDALDKWLGRIPGRLSLLAVAGGTVFATLTGASMASVAMLGSTLAPEMQKRGYKKAMSLGPIMGAGGLAMMIPPSNLAVLIGAIGEISIGKILMAIIVPGLILAAAYAIYIIARCYLQPSLAPAYDLVSVTWSNRVISFMKYILPISFIIFLVIGCMLLGVTDPAEASAGGALGMFILAACYKRLSWEVFKKSIAGALRITVMIFIILVGANAFGQIMAYSGVGKGLADFADSLPVAPILIIFGMQVILIIMGMFMEPASIMMVTCPLFVPIVRNLGFDTVWFAVLYLVNMEMAVISPPFGLNLFAMKAVASSDVSMGDIYRSSIPFLGLEFLVLILILLFPSIAQWLPSLMR